MIKFQSLVAMIEEYGLDELHRMHQDDKATTGRVIPFDDFVNEYYEDSKKEWESNVNYRKAISLSNMADPDSDICTESAKFILEKIIQKAVDNGEVGRIIEEEQLSPDTSTNITISNCFWFTIIPTLEKAMKGI